MLYTLCLAAVIIIILAYLLGWLDESTNLPPGPERKFILGNYQDLDKARVHCSLHNLFKKFGPIVYLKMIGRNVVVLNSAKVLRKAFNSTELKELMNDKPKGFYGNHLVYGHQDVLFGPYSETTFKLKAVMHKCLQPAMKESQIEAEAKQLVDKFKKTNGDTFDPRPIIEDTLADMMSHLLSGDVHQGDSKLLWAFVNSSNNMLNPSVEGVLKQIPILRYAPGTHGCLYREARDNRNALLKRFVDDYKSTYNPKVLRGFVDTCLKTQEADKGQDGVSWLTDDCIRAILLDTVGGGLPANAESILGAVLNVLHNKQCVRKMVFEIDTVLGRDEIPNRSHMKRMPYCHAVILETLRLTSVVPVVNHSLSKQSIEFEGFTIPKDTILVGNIWSAHHDENLWKDSWTFRPERFLDDKGNLLSPDHELRQSLMPYGLGARYCIGDVFSEIRAFVYVTALVQQFDFLPPEGGTLVSNDPNLCSGGAVLHMPAFTMRASLRH